MTSNEFASQVEATRQKYPEWFEVAEALGTTPIDDKADEFDELMSVLAGLKPMELYATTIVAGECGNSTLLALISQFSLEVFEYQQAQAAQATTVVDKFANNRTVEQYAFIEVTATQLLFNSDAPVQ